MRACVGKHLLGWLLWMNCHLNLLIMKGLGTIVLCCSLGSLSQLTLLLWEISSEFIQWRGDRLKFFWQSLLKGFSSSLILRLLKKILITYALLLISLMTISIKGGPRWRPRGPGPLVQFCFFLKIFTNNIHHFCSCSLSKTLGPLQLATIQPRNLTKTIKTFTMVIDF